jgi:hypothetical protein
MGAGAAGFRSTPPSAHREHEVPIDDQAAAGCGRAGVAEEREDVPARRDGREPETELASCVHAGLVARPPVPDGADDAVARGPKLPSEGERPPKAAADWT